MKFSIKIFFGKCHQMRQESADLVTFTVEIFNWNVVIDINNVMW